MSEVPRASRVLEGRFRGDDWAEIVQTVRLRWPDAVAEDDLNRVIVLDGLGTPSRPTSRVRFTRKGAGAPASFDLVWGIDRVSFSYDTSARILIDYIMDMLQERRSGRRGRSYTEAQIRAAWFGSDETFAAFFERLQEISR